MNNEKMKPCPFCGEMPSIYGQEVRGYVDGVWAEMTRKEYWVQTKCLPSCLMGNMQVTAYGVVGGIRYESEEAAIKAWNKRGEKMNDWTIERVSQIMALLEDAKKAAKTAKLLALSALTASVINLVCVVIAHVLG